MKSVSHSCQAILKSILLCIFCLLVHSVSSQISYGGKPLPLHSGMGARAVVPAVDLFMEMPSFDSQAALRSSQQDRSNLKSLEFAHKFHPFLRPDNSGITFVNGNMMVWRVGIRSKGAYSLNLLFSKFRLPPGAQLFVYNSDQTEILGSYTEKNNSDLNMLPVQPVSGDELIVEYQEPLEPAFSGEIEIGEVNHDFLGILRANQPDEFGEIGDCHPNLICYPEDNVPGRGVVVLIINGVTACTGVLVNNTENDGTPYLLTATHCLNSDYNSTFLKNRKYDLIAGSIVAFFNYNSPLCDTDIRGPLQMTMASADSVLISERHDISLLKLKEVPPAEYQPYYLGWNANSNSDASSAKPFHGLHHPRAKVKKVAIEAHDLSFGSFRLPNPDYPSEPSSFWEVGSWDVAATAPGSSGSPLLDKDKKVLGTLTGGISECLSSKGPDSYGSLAKFWDVQGSLDNPNAISYYLSPNDPSIKKLDGFNPYENQPYTRSHNFKTNDKAITYLFDNVPLFATNNPFGYTEFAEQFYARSNMQLRGVFLSSPPVKDAIAKMNIRIRVYSGENGPERILYEQPYDYSYRYYYNSNFMQETRNMGAKVENYVRFNNPVAVSGSFYVSYYDENGVPSGFSVFNAEPRNIESGIASTAWIKKGTEWMRSSENPQWKVNTALLIAPYVIGKDLIPVELEKEATWLQVYHNNADKRIYLESNNELAEWDLYYSSGIKIHHETANISINKASYSSVHLIKGVYIVRARTVDGMVATKKIIIR